MCGGEWKGRKTSSKNRSFSWLLETVTRKKSNFCFWMFLYKDVILDLLQPSCGYEGDTSHHFIIIIICLLLLGEKGMLSFWRVRIVFILTREDECLSPLNILPVLNPTSYFCLHNSSDSDPLSWQSS